MVEGTATGGLGQPELGAAQRLVATLPSLGEAEMTVRRLSLEGAPADRMAIVGVDVQAAERVVGRVSTPVVAGRSAAMGALVGAAISWMLWAVDLARPLVVPVWMVIDSAVVGGAVGAIAGLIVHAFTLGRRWVGTAGGVKVGRYEILADAEVADHVAYLLRAEQRAGIGPATVPGAETGQAVPGQRGSAAEPITPAERTASAAGTTPAERTASAERDAETGQAGREA